MKRSTAITLTLSAFAAAMPCVKLAVATETGKQPQMIARAGSQQPGEGPAEYFTGTRLTRPGSNGFLTSSQPACSLFTNQSK